MKNRILFAAFLAMTLLPGLARGQGIRIPGTNVEFDYQVSLGVLMMGPGEVYLTALWNPEQTGYNRNGNSTGYFWGFCEFHPPVPSIRNYSLGVAAAGFLHPAAGPCDVALTTGGAGFVTNQRWTNLVGNPSFSFVIDPYCRLAYRSGYEVWSVNYYPYGCGLAMAPTTVAMIFSISQL
jgi:hypothetical protein